MKPYFEIDELEKWLITHIDSTKYKILNCFDFISVETEKNSKYYLEIFSTGKLELKRNSYRKDDNSNTLLNELINYFLDENLLIFWSEKQQFGYLLKDKNDLLGLINVLFRANMELKEELENLREEHKSHSHSEYGSY